VGWERSCRCQSKSQWQDEIPRSI